MTTLFYRLTTDGRQLPAALDDAFAGPVASACWLIGGGPSLAELPHRLIDESPVPKMSVNLSGTRILRPNFWTSYDPSARFHRSVYLDPGILKFVHRRRAMDLVPETTYKVCECPGTYFFERDGQRGFHQFLSPTFTGIVDWADSMVQAIDILYRLGFRTIYLAGCEMRVRLSDAQLQCAEAAGIEAVPGELLRDFLGRAEQAGVDCDTFDALPAGPHYHFDEQKHVRAAANTDAHYFRIAQYLRLSRRSLALAGLQLISVTPGSRLNDYFPYRTVEEACRQIVEVVGDPRTEPVRGLYQQIDPRQPAEVGPMRDFKPHNWKAPAVAAVEKPVPANEKLVVEAEGYQQAAGNGRQAVQQRLRGALDAVGDAEPALQEMG